MNSELTTEELFKLLQDRYNNFTTYSGFSLEGKPYDEELHNGVIATLKATVESFSMGRLQVVPKVIISSEHFVNTIEQAQSVLDGVMLKLEDYKIPATQQILTSLENILNNNGFSGVRIIIDPERSLLKPVVVEASHYIDLFGQPNCSE